MKRATLGLAATRSGHAQILYMLPDLPKIKKLIAKKITAFYEAGVRFHSDGMVREMPVRYMHEGSVLKSEYSEDFVHETPIKKIAASGTFDMEEIIDDP